MPIMDNWTVPMDHFGQRCSGRYSDGLLDAQPRTRPNLLRHQVKVDGPERSVRSMEYLKLSGLKANVLRK